VFGAASPQVGWRYRLEVSHATGATAFSSVTADGRWYQPVWRGSFAVRGMHVGRHGRDAWNGAMVPMFIGAGTLVRGYDAESLAARECWRAGSGGCRAFEQLLGSRMAVANLEYRLPFDRLGLGGLQLELAPFIDAGLAWRSGDQLSLAPRPLTAGNDGRRRPVWSHGLAARLNAGAVIIEIFHARPMQRGIGTFGVNLAPGW